MRAPTQNPQELTHGRTYGLSRGATAHANRMEPQNRVSFPAMPRHRITSQTRQRGPVSALGGVETRVSPDDVRFLEIAHDQRMASDQRTPAQVWLGEPETGRSALHQRRRQPEKR
jgi:hypothetical protein